jgi:hypothetical protein
MTRPNWSGFVFSCLQHGVDFHVLHRSSSMKVIFFFNKKRNLIGLGIFIQSLYTRIQLNFFLLRLDVKNQLQFSLQDFRRNFTKIKRKICDKRVIAIWLYGHIPRISQNSHKPILLTYVYGERN